MTRVTFSETVNDLVIFLFKAKEEEKAKTVESSTVGDESTKAKSASQIAKDMEKWAKSQKKKAAKQQAE